MSVLSHAIDACARAGRGHSSSRHTHATNSHSLSPIPSALHDAAEAGDLALLTSLLNKKEAAPYGGGEGDDKDFDPVSFGKREKNGWGAGGEAARERRPS